MTRALSEPSAARARLSARDKLGLGAEVLLAYGRVRRVAGRVPLPDALAALRATPPGAARVEPTWEDPVHVARRLARVTARTLSVLPADSRCLNRSLTLTVLLARRGVPSLLVIAVKPGGEFGAHAWLEYRGHPLLPPADAGYETLVTL